MLTEIGEVGVYAGEVQVVLRPSLRAMAALGDPEEIVALYERVMSGSGDPKARNQDAQSVIYACAPETDIANLFGLYGCVTPDGEVPGAAPEEHAITLARHLLKHGVTGAIPPDPKAEQRADYVRTFVARENAALAMAHLGLTEREAWDMTMTGLVSVLKAKYPPAKSEVPGASAPTKEEHEQTMAWFERVEEMRRKRSGVH